ncbi:hypothetical protein [Luteolibacter soli]|uniref:Uncharacterized protein n=1 Tax=Luteolibacter soli TaxID=3135280 RepID=A0ABU9AVF1_9BACT
MRPLSASDKFILSLLHLATWIVALAGIAAIAGSIYSIVRTDLWSLLSCIPTAIVCFAQAIVFHYVRTRLTDDLTRY